MVIHRCDKCGYAARCKSWLLRHAAKHSDSKPFACDLCPKRFNSNSALLLHTKEMHSSTTYMCSICCKEFAQKRVRDIHMRTVCRSGQEVRRHVCQLCPYKAKMKHHLTRHIRTMHGNDPPRTKVQEERVSSMLTSLNVRFVREFSIKTPTFEKRRAAKIDFAIRRDWGWLFVECDEMQHLCCKIEHEVLRMCAIHSYAQEHWNGKLHIVRYNPHSFKTYDGSTKRPSEQTRFRAIQACLQYVPAGDFEITYVFYSSEQDGMPKITKHADFSLNDHVWVLREGDLEPEMETA